MTTTVRVYCDDASHAGKVAEVETFERHGGGWRVVDRRVTGDARARGLTAPDWHQQALKRLKPASVERVADGQVYPGRATAAATSPLHGGRGHVRYRLRCSLCGLDVQMLEDKWHGRLDMLTAAGVSKISLPALAASL